jgi:hypothetical protein
MGNLSCPFCGSVHVQRERRPNGKTICKDCAYSNTSVKWDEICRVKSELGTPYEFMPKEEDELPIGCRKRMQFVLDKAKELSETFRNGNKNDFLKQLDMFPLYTAYAIIATCVDQDSEIARFLREKA